MPAASATASTTARSVALSMAPVRSRTVSPPTIWAEATSAPASSAAVCTCSSTASSPGSRKLLPPAKSMPKLKPRKIIEARHRRTTTAVTL